MSALHRAAQRALVAAPACALTADSLPYVDDGASGAPWTPLQLGSTVKFWIEGDNPLNTIVETDRYSAADDLAGTTNATQGTSGNRPRTQGSINGHQAFRLNRADVSHFEHPDLAISTSRTIVAVWQLLSLPGAGVAFELCSFSNGVASSQRVQITDADLGPIHFCMNAAANSAGVKGGPASTTATPVLGVFTHTGDPTSGTYGLRINRVAQTLVAGADMSLSVAISTPGQIGAVGINDSSPADLDIVFLLAADTVLSAANIGRLEAYLNRRFGV